jgi:hypothetical protein
VAARRGFVKSKVVGKRDDRGATAHEDVGSSAATCDEGCVRMLASIYNAVQVYEHLSRISVEGSVVSADVDVGVKIIAQHRVERPIFVHGMPGQISHGSRWPDHGGCIDRVGNGSQ